MILAQNIDIKRQNPCDNVPLSYKSFFYQVNQLTLDNSKPSTGTLPSEEKPAAKGQEDDGLL